MWVFDTGDPRWLDEAADGPVTYLRAGEFSVGLWKHVFWNRSIVAVAQFDGTLPINPLVPVELALAPDGLLTRVDGRAFEPALLSAPTDLRLEGEQVAVAPRSTDLPGRALWRVDRPARLLSWQVGVQPNGDIVGTAQITVYACGPGRLELTLLGKHGTPIEIRVNGVTAARPRVAANAVWNGSVPAPPDADGRLPCLFELVSPGLVGSTRLEFVRE